MYLDYLIQIFVFVFQIVKYKFVPYWASWTPSPQTLEDCFFMHLNKILYF